MGLISIRSLTMAFAGPPLLDEINCQFEPGDRIGLLGRNGAGKSTLLKLIAGSLAPDSGSVIVSPGVTVAMLGQDVPQDIEDDIFGVVSRGALEQQREGQEDWRIQYETSQILSRMELDPQSRFESLSSGMKRRVLLAKALVSKPDFLLLDEPTNHLDLDAIEWLEKFLSQHVASFMFVTHDRMFLRRMANRILEIDRGRIFDWACDYENFLVRKELVLASEEKEQALFDKRLVAEEVWIRKGIKARRTRNEGRVRALESMRVERSQRREKIGTAELQIQEGQKSGNLVVGLQQVSFGYQGNTIIDRFSTVVMRGDKIGIIGPNGAGKSTLLKLMLGELEPTTGGVKLGTNLQIAYFDQLREQLDPEASVQENVGDGYDMIQLGGGKKHVLGYLQDFLFTPERARTQVKFLSGGERNRLLLAKLFAKPANLIVLDEPTNDLDAETLEMLEERITQFAGTIITVSHDRAFLNNVVSGILSFEDNKVVEYVGGYDDWQRQYLQKQGNLGVKGDQGESKKGQKKGPQKEQKKGPQKASQKEQPGVLKTELENPSAAPAPSNVSAREAAVQSVSRVAKSKKLKFRDKLELEQLPKRIEQLDADLAALNAIVNAADFYRRPKEEIVDLQDQLSQKESELNAAYQRLEELEKLAE